MKIMRNLVVVAGLLVATVAAKAQDQALIDAAKAEGQVVWYSGLIVRQVVTPIKDAFEKKYGITVNFVSMASQEAALRILNEGRANNIQGDVFDGTAPLSAAMEAGLVEQYVPQEAANYPAELKDPNGYWTGQIVQVTAPAINTGLVSAADAPKTFEDLLDPKWKGKMAWSSSEEIAGPPGFIGNVLSYMGEEKGMAYLEKLSQQQIANVPSNMRVVLDQGIAGQYPLVLSILNYHAAISAAQGAPVEWLKLESSVFTFGTVQMLKNAPHPSAAKLFLEFLLSDEGQQIIADAGYIPASPRVKAKDPTLKPQEGKFAVTVISSETFAMNKDKWVGIYRKLFK
ncbi:extracellular solute-binding protein [Mesorhizobium sp.]|uniref:ABC transporter substrate-binding protein n=1 Tax=Mesorhizobium sp. TaxID=1871066 RepID=UPI000FE9CC63|nr:extracellular solute-binding protein [Mesorhizobium sp.]RWD61717.1 MAG: extracellular solute-binding protein [Mesorhizobium sp.]TIV54191.1 MAG: extracellular solute-binding protein [Mesorhizobium sp.]